MWLLRVKAGRKSKAAAILMQIFSSPSNDVFPIIQSGKVIVKWLISLFILSGVEVGVYDGMSHGRTWSLLNFKHLSATRSSKGGNKGENILFNLKFNCVYLGPVQINLTTWLLSKTDKDKWPTIEKKLSFQKLLEAFIEEKLPTRRHLQTHPGQSHPTLSSSSFPSPPNRRRSNSLLVTI